MTIAFLDDHPLFIESMRVILLQQNGIDSVTLYNNGSNFLMDVKDNPADILVLDIMMPGIDGLKVLEIFRKENKQTKIIVLTFIENIQLLKQSIRMGANGFISKSCSIKELINAIYEVNDGNQYISETLKRELISTKMQNDLPVFHLTSREKEVLTMICKGLSIQEIADALNVSYYTAQYYNRNIMSKFKVKRSADIIVFAVLYGFYIPEENTN